MLQNQFIPTYKTSLSQLTKPDGINVLSLFDGMSCGHIALERAGIKVNNYFASEIDKYAIKVTQTNYPKTKQLGCVIDSVNWNLPKIDLLIGGSPCQGFSFAGKQLNFDDERSKLFFEFVAVWYYCRKQNPNVLFLLENVNMKKEFQDIISSYLGVDPIRINSSLVSGGLRDRLYWANIRVHQPADKKILFQSILQSDEARIDKAYALTATYHKKGAEPTRQRNFIKHQRPIAWIDDNTTRWLTPLECERLQTVPEGYTSCVSNSQRYKMLGNGWTIDVIVGILSGIKLKQMMGLI